MVIAPNCLPGSLTKAFLAGPSQQPSVCLESRLLLGSEPCLPDQSCLPQGTVAALESPRHFLP